MGHVGHGPEPVGVRRGPQLPPWRKLGRSCSDNSSRRSAASSATVTSGGFDSEPRSRGCLRRAARPGGPAQPGLDAACRV